MLRALRALTMTRSELFPKRQTRPGMRGTGSAQAEGWRNQVKAVDKLVTPARVVSSIEGKRV